MTITYRTLENTTDRQLYEAFVKAFSDYQVKINMELEHFVAINTMRGYDPTISIGAFDGDTLAGFVMSGSGVWRGEPAAYDMGTGIIPELRGSGIGKHLISELENNFRQHPHRLYLLEVLKENAPAVALYQKSGFQKTRDFICLKNPDGFKTLRQLDSKAEIKPIAPLSYAESRKFQDWEPAWQNSIQALSRCPKPLVWLGAFIGDELTGYGVISGTGGQLFQFAVKKPYRRKGAGSKLLLELARTRQAEKPELSIINIDSSDTAGLEFLKNNGFSVTVEQFEMTKRLK